VRVLAEVTKKVISEEGLTIEDIDYFIFHQANKRIIDAVSKSLNIPPEKMVVNIDRVGNTSTASIPLALEDLRRERGLNKGDLLLLASFGAGLTWGANIVRWSKEGS
jgi:3-oxoacyl-[acyl-carrier-protein] synthase-3